MRRRVARGLLALLLVASVAVLDASPASACICAGTLTREQVADADAVFIGTWREQVGMWSEEGQRFSSPELWSVEVDALHVGEVHREEVVATEAGSCSPAPRAGGMVGAVAERSSGPHLSLGLCSTFSPDHLDDFFYAHRDDPGLAAVVEAAHLVDGRGPSPDDRGIPTVAWVIGGVAGLFGILVLLGILEVRPRRTRPVPPA